MIKGAFETAVHHRGGYRYVRIHEFEEGGLVVGRGVVISWVVVSLFVEDNDVTFELQLGIGGVGGVLVRTVVRGSLRQVWRGGDEVVVEMIVEMRGGEGWGIEGIVYIVMAVHGGGGIGAFCNLCNESDPSVGCVRKIEMVKIGGKKKKGLRAREERKEN